MKATKAFQFSAFLRGLFLIFSALVCTAILTPPAIFSSLLNPSGRWPSFFQRTWSNWLLRTNGVRLRPQGLQHPEKRKAYIFIANHNSILDIPGIISAFPFPVRFIAKKSLIWFPIFGWFLSLSGHVLIDRENAKSALLSLKKAVALLKKGVSIVVFPEGTRSPDGQVKDFKGGAFLLALQSKASLVPVSISGTYSMLPRTGWCFWPGIINLIIGKPISTHNLSLHEARPLMKRVREIIVQNLGAQA
jgi:1-acyl-sn-glycerol-3-phosphate acyltransferase